MPQLQLSMECLDLDVCHFVQYRPTNGEFDPFQMEVTVVPRDRMWFAKNLPLFQKFISDLEEIRTLGPVNDEPPEKEPRTITKKRKFDKFLVAEENDLRNDNIRESVLEINDCVSSENLISDVELTSQHALLNPVY